MARRVLRSRLSTLKHLTFWSVRFLLLLKASRCRNNFQHYLLQCDQIGRWKALGLLFKACGNNYFVQIDHIFRQFLQSVKIFHFSSEIIFRQLLLRHLATFYWSHCLQQSLFLVSQWNSQMYTFEMIQPSDLQWLTK